MTQAVMENALSPRIIDQLFEDVAERQFTRNLLFSSIVELMSLVVCRIQPSINAAYVKNAVPINVSLQALYRKIERIETSTGSALVRMAAERLAPVITALGGEMTPFLPAYRTKILDGNPLPGTEHRILELRTMRAGALPGQALVVFDPRLMLAIDAILCEDGHAQERSLLVRCWRPWRRGTSGSRIATSAPPTSSSGSPVAAVSSSSASTPRRCIPRSSASGRRGDGSRPGRSSSRRCGPPMMGARSCSCGACRWSWTSRHGMGTPRSIC